MRTGKKPKTSYRCKNCEHQSPRWAGKCPSCNEWDTLEECITRVATKTSNAAAVFAESIAEQGSMHEAASLLDIKAPAIARISTGIEEFNRVLGGGLVVGSVVLLGGDPGIGKSTLMMQVAMQVTQRGERVLYATSEESAYQCKMRAERLCGGFEQSKETYSGLKILADTDLANIQRLVEANKPSLLIVDSIQMVHRGDLDASPGSVKQIRRCCLELVYLAREYNMAVIVVGHVTKDGQLAGPRVLEHMVDVLLSFEGDRHHGLRSVRGVKNRFGTTLEIGLFEMTQSGLKEVGDAAAFLDPDMPPRAGAVACPAMHGSRCFVVEIQALVAQGTYGQAKRRATGVDGSRLTMLAAVLEQHASVQLIDQDIYAGSVGGLRLVEPAIDLALCMAVIGAHLGHPLPAGWCAIGEIGLGGEVRGVPHIEQRVAQAKRRGYTTILVPITQIDKLGQEAVPVASIADLTGLLEKNNDNNEGEKMLSDEKKMEDSLPC
ncbi:MAG: DNA repair protein RadA [Phycisphaerales bacterium]|jgi:DNA repair protein RadA/Sms|nr:DNA repair protein RadA [Phycisphaerales bacterium]